MAEAAVPKDKRPPEPKGEPPKEEFNPLKHAGIEGINSLEVLFARDLITYVMRRRIPFWDFDDEFGGSSHVTPFSFRIRNAVEHYLVKEGVNIYFCFANSFTGLPLEYKGFVIAFNQVRDSVFPSVNTPNDLLRLLALCAQYAVLAYKRGIHMAPYFALLGIQKLLCSFIQQKKIHPHVFFATLGSHAENLMRETSTFFGYFGVM